jgi:hypothetical protein
VDGWAVCEVWLDRWAEGWVEREGKGWSIGFEFARVGEREGKGGV